MDHPITRRQLGSLAAGALAASRLKGQAATDPVLDIAEWSYKFYGIEHATLARGTVCNGMQMYVEHWIPSEVKHPYPVVLIHGGYGQGSDWFTNTDGSRGWVSLFLEQGYKVYVVDRPGQGRNPYHPYVHGNFDAQAPTFEKTAAEMGIASISDTRVAQAVASLGQRMPNNANTQKIWRSRGAILLDEIGPSVLITDGDGVDFARLTAQERPALVKRIIAVDPGPMPRESLLEVHPVTTISSDRAGGIRLQTGRNPTAFDFTMKQLEEAEAGAVRKAPVPDPHPNRESTALRLRDQGGFWIGVGQKTMPYGTIAQGQMFVQYMKPAKKRYAYPVVMVHGGGGQGTHMMGIGGRPGWVHYFVQEGYDVYWIDRPSYGRSPYHPDALGPSHLPSVPPIEGLLLSNAVFNTAQWPGTPTIDDPNVNQFMACESGNVSDEAFHSDLAWRGGVELVDKIGPCILLTHAFGGFFAWGVADRRPNLIKGIFAMEINGNPFAAQLRWGLTASPITYDPPVKDSSEFKLVDHQLPPDAPRPLVNSYKLQAEPAHQWKNLKSIPIGWLTTEFGGGGSPVPNVEFLKQVGCSAEMVRLRDWGILGNGNLMLLEKNNHEVFGVVRDWLAKKVGGPA